MGETELGSMECNVNSAQQFVGDITDLGTQEMRILYSPGYINGVQ